MPDQPGVEEEKGPLASPKLTKEPAKWKTHWPEWILELFTFLFLTLWFLSALKHPLQVALFPRIAFPALWSTGSIFFSAVTLSKILNRKCKEGLVEDSPKKNVGTSTEGIVYWVIISSLVSLLASGFILWLGQYMVVSPTSWWGYDFAKVLPDKVNPHGPTIQAAVGIAGAIFSAFIYFLNRAQKEDHFEKQRAQERDENKAQRDQERDENAKQQDLQQKHFDKQRAQERAQAEYDAIASQYDALSKDFTSDNTLARINAAIGLAAIAKTPDPLKLFKEDRSEPAEKTQDYFPWYERVAMQLTAALNLYSRREEREPVVGAIRSMFQLDKGESQQPLLLILLDHLAAANRSAYSSFLEHFVDAFLYFSEEPGIIIHQLPFFKDQRVYGEFLSDFVSQSDVKLLVSVKRELLNLSEKASVNQDHLRDLGNAAQKLVDTRDLIGDGVVLAYSSKYHMEITDTLIDLSSCFLQGIQLNHKSIANVRAIRSQFQRSNFGGCNIHRVTFDQCSFQDTRFNTATIADTDFYSCKMAGSFFWKVKLKSVAMEEESIKEIHFYLDRIPDPKGVFHLVGPEDIETKNAWMESSYAY